MKRKEENRSVIEPSCTFFKPSKINFLPSNRVLDWKPDRVTGYKVLINLTSLVITDLYLVNTCNIIIMNIIQRVFTTKLESNKNKIVHLWTTFIFGFQKYHSDLQKKNRERNNPIIVLTHLDIHVPMLKIWCTL